MAQAENAPHPTNDRTRIVTGWGERRRKQLTIRSLRVHRNTHIPSSQDGERCRQHASSSYPSSCFTAPITYAEAHSTGCSISSRRHQVSGMELACALSPELKVAIVPSLPRKRRGAHVSRRRKISHSTVKQKGQLKLSIDMQGRLLVLHIMEAKGLMGKEYRTCNSYVKMSVVPDTDRKCRQKTKTVPDSKNPIFHEHFLFPVQEEDEHKRLLVTVWNQERNSR
nr:regulator of G-protein signaling 3-like [Chelonoidis abingdonii]